MNWNLQFSLVKSNKNRILPFSSCTEWSSNWKGYFQRNLGVFLVNLTETLDRLPIICNKKQSEIDYSVQNISILLRFVFNSKSKVNIT